MNFQVLSANLPGIVVAVASFLGVLAMLSLIKKQRELPSEDEEWRDPPPMMYRLFKPLVRLITPEANRLISDKRKEVLAAKLSAAGFGYAILPQEFVVLKYLCFIFGGLVSLLTLKSNPDVGTEIYVFVVTFAPIGFFYPDLWLSDQITRRKSLVIKEFPFLLDLLVLGMRAGLNYSGALSHAIGAMPKGAVKEEFGKVLREIRAGKSRREALLALGDRMNIEAINNFVAAVNQAEETGGEIVEVLVTQADQRRNERFGAAEVKANKAPVQMLIPMVLFLFPILFMLLAFIIMVKLNAMSMLPDSVSALLVRKI